MTERRFTDRDVALILRRAAELDSRADGDAVSKGLSIDELRGIASEVGIDPEMVSRAAVELEGRKGLERGALLGAPTVNRQIRAVPGELSREALRHLIRRVDEQVPAQGTVAEALGAVRWSAPGRFLSRQVTLEPGRGETVIRTEERYQDRVRAMAHFIPMAYATFIGGIFGAEAIGGAAPTILLAGIAGGAVWTAARAVWNRVSRQSHHRVRTLADELADEAVQLTDAAEVVEAAND